MFDSLTVARQLTAAGIDRAQADAIADGIRQAAEHQPGDPATKADIAALETRLLKWMVGIVLTVAGIQTAALIAVLRMLLAD